MAASTATSSRRRPATRRRRSVSGRPTVRGLSSARRAFRNWPSSLRCALLFILASLRCPPLGWVGRFYPWIHLSRGGILLCTGPAGGDRVRDRKLFLQAVGASVHPYGHRRRIRHVRVTPLPEKRFRRKDMRATVIHAPGDIRVEDAPEPKIVNPTDAIIRT